MNARITSASPLGKGPIQRRKAFTLTELLVVLAVIALLACLQLPGLARVKTQTWIVQCSGNLRQVAMCQTLYGLENNGRLPTPTNVAWPWDVPNTLYKTLQSYNAVQTNPAIFFCPSTPQANPSLFSFSTTLIGCYAFTFPNSTTYVASYSTNANFNLTPTPIAMFSPGSPIVVPSASKRVLMADTEICAGPSYTPTQPLSTYNFTDIIVGANLPFPDGRHYRAAHLVGTVPLGGNQAMLDGHVEWRPLRSSTYNMIQRDQGQPPNGAPCFLW